MIIEISYEFMIYTYKYVFQFFSAKYEAGMVVSHLKLQANVL